MKKIYIFFIILAYIFYLSIFTYKGEEIISKNVYITSELVYVKSINNKFLLKNKYENNIYDIKENGNYTLYFKNNKYIGYKGSIFNKIRKYFENIIEKNFKYYLYSYAKAILLYDKKSLSIEDQEIIKKIGISHIFSLSGFHLSLIYMFIINFFKRFNNIIKELFSMILITIYVMTIGFIPSITRAYIIILISSLSHIFKENIDSNKSFKIAFIITFFINPYQLFNISYILTYLVTYLIINLEDKNILYKNIIIELFTLPIILYIFKSFNLIMFFINLLLLPLFTLFIYLLIFSIIFNLNILIFFLEEYLHFIRRIMYLLSKIDIFIIKYNIKSFFLIIIIYIFLLIYYRYKIEQENIDF